MSKYGVVSGLYFPAFSPNTEKYEPEMTPYLAFFSRSAIKPNLQTLCIEANIFRHSAITNQPVGNEKIADSHKITPLMVECRFQSNVWLFR